MIFRLVKRLLARLPLALLPVLACGQAVAPPVSGTIRVLFIGNSLTFANDMPSMLTQLADSTGDSLQIEVRDISKPDYALEDHLNDPFTMQVLAESQWDVVVLQQGPSSLPENQVNLREFAFKFAIEIRAVGARPALYMVWPDETRLAFFDDVRNAYSAAAEAAEAALYPAGEAWRVAWAEDPALELYGGDGYHPSGMGSYLAALTIYRGLTGRSLKGLPSFGISAHHADILSRAAITATEQFGRP